MAKYEPTTRNTCPHCLTVVRFENPPEAHEKRSGYNISMLGVPDYQIYQAKSMCPSCFNIIICLEEKIVTEDNQEEWQDRVIWPLVSGWPPAPPEVTDNIAQDYNEACIVLPFSPKASAALSRRCLQTVLTDAGNTQSNNLSTQIDEVLDLLPSHIAANVDAIREIGNFAAHEQKSVNTGTILDVEPGEAEWNIETLLELFDFYYVKPEQGRLRREDFNQKLRDAGRRPLRQPDEEGDGEETG